MKRLVFLIMLFVSMLSLRAEIKTGKCGDYVTYSFDTETGVLKISGSGRMDDETTRQDIYGAYQTTAPWGQHWESLTSVIIENGVTSIGTKAFYGCWKITSVSIPNSVTSIGANAFYGCKNITSVVIPNSMTSIGREAFYNCGLTSVSIPNSVTSISESAFGCSGLTSVTIPNSVTNIGERAFESCYDLTSVTIGNSVTSIGNYVFYHCYHVKELIYAEGCTTVFSTGLKSLTSVTIPNSVTCIEGGAFYNCSGLTSVTIPNSVTSVGYHAFEGSAWYENLPDGLVYIGLVAYSYKGVMPEGTSIFIKEGTKEIGKEAFYKCSGLTSVTIPNSVSSIGYGAFYGCSGLTSVTIPNSVTNIENKTFENCSSLTFVIIPNSVTNIGNEAFAYCSSLTSVTLGTSVSTIGSCTFSNCKIESIIFPKSVTEIGKNSFSGNNLKAIHFKGFLPDSYENLFSECASSLLEMSLADPVPPTLSNDFFKNTKYRSGTLYVPDKAVEAYSSTLPWYAWGEIRPLSELKLEGGAVDELAELKKLYLALQVDKEALEKELESQKTTYTALQAKYNGVCKELEMYRLGDLNMDGETDIRDVETLIKLSSYSSEETAISLLIEETGITLSEIDDLYGKVEFYTLDGKKVSEPSQSCVYIIKKNGETKMIVVKK